MPIRTPDVEVPEGVVSPYPENEWYNEVMRPRGQQFNSIPEPHEGDPRVQRPDIPYEAQRRAGPLYANPDRFMGSEKRRRAYNLPKNASFTPDEGGGQDVTEGGDIPLAPWEQKAAPAKQEGADIPLAPWEKGKEEPTANEGFGLTPEDVAPSAVPKSLATRAKEEGVGTEAVDAATRFNAALAYGALGGSLEKEKELFRRAIERDYKKRAEVEYNEKLGQLVYRLEGGDGQWQLVKGAGPSSLFKDIAAATPELMTAATEVAFGIPGTVAGEAIGGPVGGVAGGALLASTAGGTAKLAQLLAARNKGLIDLSDDEIFQLAKEHAMWTAGGTVATATVLKVLGTAWRLMTGKPAELLDTFKDQKYLIEGKSLADKLRTDAETLAAQGGMRRPTVINPDGSITPGEPHEFPVTAGQQSAIGGGKVIGPGAGRPGERYVPPAQSDAALAAEERLVTRNAGAPVKSVLDKQSEAINDADFAVFGARSSEPVSDAGRVLRSAINEARAQKAEKFQSERTLLEAGKKINERELAVTGNRTPMAAMEDARARIDNAREALWQPINTAYQGLEKMQTQNVFLEPFRAAARGIERKYGQSIVPEVSVTEKGPGGQLISSAKMAGLDSKIVNGVEKLSSRPSSIAEIELLRKDINYALRQAQKGTAEDSQIRARILGELRQGIDDSLAQSLPAESIGRILALRHAYSELEEKFNKGILSTITEKTEDGRYVLAGQDVAEFLTKNLDNAKAFTDALRSSDKFIEASGKAPARVVPVVQPEMVESLRAVQDGILARMRRQFYDYDTGKWDSKGMAAWIGDRREALSELFRYKGGVNVKTGELTFRDAGRDNIIDKTFRNQKLLQQTIESQEARAAKAQQLYDKRFGVFTDDPAVLARRLIDDGRVGDLRAASRLVGTVGGKEAQETFKRGLTQAARGELTDGRGAIRPEKVDEFLLSARGKALTEVLGDEWAKNVRTLGDMVKVRELEASGMASQEIAETIGRSVPGLRSIARFARVIFPPWSPRGRGLTATLGLMNEKSQRQMGELLADPEKLAELVELSKRQGDPFGKAMRVQMTRLGFGHLGDAYNALKSFDENVMENFATRPTEDERQGKAQYDRMGQPAEVPEEPIKFQDRPGQGRGPVKMESGGGTMQLDDGQGLTGMPGETERSKTQNIPGSFSGAMDTLTPHFQTNFGDENYTGRESTNVEDRRFGDQFQSEHPKGQNGIGVPMRLDGGRDMAYQTEYVEPQGKFGPGRLPETGDRLRGSVRIMDRGDGQPRYEEGQIWKPGSLDDGGVGEARAWVDSALKQDPATAIQRDLKPRVDRIIESVGGAASAIGKALGDTLEKAVTGSGEEQHRAAVELALLVTGAGGSRFAFTGPRAAETTLGAGGGGLPPIKPPARSPSREATRERLSTVEGGPGVVKEHIDALSANLSKALRDAHEAVRTGEGDIPSQVKNVRRHISALERESDGLMHEANQLGPPLTPFTKWQLRQQGRSPESYKLELMDQLNAEVDAGKREAFRLMATGKDVKKEVTLANVKDWLEAAGVQELKVNKHKGGTEYLTFPDPSANTAGLGYGRHKTSVRFPEDAHSSGGPVKNDVIDTSTGPGRGSIHDVRVRNVSEESFSQWENLIDALKFRLSKSPDGQWLISPDKAPKPGSFRQYRMTRQREKALEASNTGDVISRDPNQLEFDFGDFGRSPFERATRGGE